MKLNSNKKAVVAGFILGTCVFFAYALFVIQMEGMKSFAPNKERHEEFAKALKKASENGVSVLAYECKVSPDTLEISLPVKVNLD